VRAPQRPLPWVGSCGLLLLLLLLPLLHGSCRSDQSTDGCHSRQGRGCRHCRATTAPPILPGLIRPLLAACLQPAQPENLSICYITMALPRRSTPTNNCPRLLATSNGGASTANGCKQKLAEQDPATYLRCTARGALGIPEPRCTSFERSLAAWARAGALRRSIRAAVGSIVNSRRSIEPRPLQRFG
jgi:hypothetical protein